MRIRNAFQKQATANPTGEEAQGVAGRRSRGRLPLMAAASMLASAAAVSVMGVGTAEAHHANGNYATSTYFNQKLRVQHTGMCLNVAYQSPYNNADVVQANCTAGATNEEWTIRHKDTDWWTGQKYYQLVVRQTGKCLDVRYGMKFHATPVVQNDCGNGWSQQWRFENLGNGFEYLIARHSNMCLNVAYASPYHAAAVVQANCSGGANEKWSHRSY